MRRQAHLTMDLSVYKRQSRQFMNTLYPMAVSKGFKTLAGKARDDMRVQVRRAFDLRSAFIPNSILSTPRTKTQVRAGAKAIDKYHDIEASVFLRPAINPSKDLSFLIPHEKGTPKTSVDGPGAIAVPVAVGYYSYKTGRGKVKKNWKPSTLLKDTDSDNLNNKGKKLASYRKGGGKRKPFLIKGKSGQLMVARRRSRKRKPIEFLYSFKKSVKIKPVLNMEETVTASVRRNYTRVMQRFINAAKPKR